MDLNKQMRVKKAYFIFDSIDFDNCKNTTNSQSIENQIVEAYLFKRNESIFCLTFFRNRLLYELNHSQQTQMAYPKTSLQFF